MFNFKSKIMKQILLFVLLVLNVHINFAQEHVQPFKIDSMLVNIEKTTFTSDILYERVFPWAGLKRFNDTTFVSNTDHFEQALYELYIASNEQKFMSYKTLRNFYTPDSLQNQVDIGVLNVTFNSVNYVPEDEKLGGLSIGSDSLFVKLNNGNPAFLDHNVLIAAPLKKYLKMEQGSNIVFHFGPDFLFQDTQGKNIVKLTANFDTSLDYTLISNGNIVKNLVPIEYSETGSKLLTITATFADNSQLTVSGTVHVKVISSPQTDPLVEDGFVHAGISFQGYDETSSHYGYLEYRIFYHTNNGNDQAILLKPIVIIDGFDPGDKRKIQDSDPHPDVSDIDHRSIEDMMSYGLPPNDVEIIPILRDIGYDVVIVNHPTYPENLVETDPVIIDGGADFIERNAMAHVALYHKLNIILEQNNSNEQLVIVGPSMGGQISRYALAYMEKQYVISQNPYWNHNTRLWVSVDSPHLGANIPMGVQTLLHLLQTYSAPNVKVDEFIEGQLGSAAARQQLIEQSQKDPNYNSYRPNADNCNGRTISQGFSQDRGHPFFTEYYNNLYNNGLPESNGYPQNQNLRKIAMANGSLMGIKGFDNPFVPGSTDDNDGIMTPDYYSYDGAKTFKIQGYANFFLGDIHIATMETYFMPSNGNNHKIAYFKQKDIIGWDAYGIYMTNNNSRGNMDNVPGGWYPTQQEIAEVVEESGPCKGPICVNYWTINNLEHVGSFIPTVSALGFSDPNFNWNQELDRDLTCTNEIPFDNYYGPRKNTQHTSFTEESVTWLLNELDGDTIYPAPTVYLDGSDISGPNVVCNGTQTTYTIPNCTVSVDWWNVSSNLNRISFTDNSVTVEPINSTVQGDAFVTAHFANGYAKKEFWVGAPEVPNNPDIDIIGSSNENDYHVYMTDYTTFNVPNLEPGLEYIWKISNNGGNQCNNDPNVVLPYFVGYNGVNPITTTSNQVTVHWGNCPADYSLTCSATNGCADTTFLGWQLVQVDNFDSNDPCDTNLWIDIVPNPVEGNIVTASIMAPPPCPPLGGNGGPDPDNYRNVQATLYDMRGNI